MKENRLDEILEYFTEKNRQPLRIELQNEIENIRKIYFEKLTINSEKLNKIDFQKKFFSNTENKNLHVREFQNHRFSFFLKISVGFSFCLLLLFLINLSPFLFKSSIQLAKKISVLRPNLIWGSRIVDTDKLLANHDIIETTHEQTKFFDWPDFGEIKIYSASKIQITDNPKELLSIQIDSGKIEVNFYKSERIRRVYLPKNKYFEVTGTKVTVDLFENQLILHSGSIRVIDNTTKEIIIISDAKTMSLSSMRIIQKNNQTVKIAETKDDDLLYKNLLFRYGNVVKLKLKNGKVIFAAKKIIENKTEYFSETGIIDSSAIDSEL